MNTANQTYLVGSTYPPEDHILRDLAIEIETDDTGQAIIQAPVTPHVCTQSGVLCAGILATLVDVVGGILAVQAISPDWLFLARYTSPWPPSPKRLTRVWLPIERILPLPCIAFRINA